MKFTVLLLGVLLLAAPFAAANEGPPEGCECETSYDCPHESCYTAECQLQQCHYEREDVKECCLNSEECCEHASEFETAVCDKDCKCVFIPTLEMECTKDEHCEQFASADECRAISACHQPVCEHPNGIGWCGCADLGQEDKDDDGVVCVDDCDDNNPLVAVSVYCLADADSDGFGDCTGTCKEICVATGETCPDNYVDVLGGENKTATENGELVGECDQRVLDFIDEMQDELCDCCDEDCLVFPDSPFGSDSPTNCGGFDYNCNGEEQKMACCDEHDDPECGVVVPVKRNVMPTPAPGTPAPPSDPRFVWDTKNCFSIDYETSNSTQCGACESGEESELFFGWACQANCNEQVSKRGKPVCPEACGDSCVCIDDDTPPQVGDCGQLVTHCVHARPDVYSDGTECCIAIGN